MEVACKDAFDHCVGRMVCQHQRDGRLVNDCIHRLRNKCFTGCDCHAMSSLLNNLLWIVTINEKNSHFLTGNEAYSEAYSGTQSRRNFGRLKATLGDLSLFCPKFMAILAIIGDFRQLWETLGNFR